jgi:hypothetical protein
VFTPAAVAPHSERAVFPKQRGAVAMTKLRAPLDPDCADEVSHVDALTSYDMEHSAPISAFLMRTLMDRGSPITKV